MSRARGDSPCEVKAMLRPGDDCYVIDAKDPTEAIAAAVSRLRAAGGQGRAPPGPSTPTNNLKPQLLSV